eukprot:13858204-Alexandrium_andersonii.AAC.1
MSLHLQAALPPPAVWQTLWSTLGNAAHAVPSMRQCLQHFSARTSSFICVPMRCSTSALDKGQQAAPVPRYTCELHATASGMANAAVHT